jgi:hypothetical protein
LIEKLRTNNLLYRHSNIKNALIIITNAIRLISYELLLQGGVEEMANRIATIDNLVKRTILQSDSQLSMHGRGVVEILPHLFFA